LLLSKSDCAEILLRGKLLRVAAIHMGIASAERHWRLERGVRRIMEVLGLLAHAVGTLVVEAALDAPLARPLVA
jgi:hypothetical protein